MRIRLGQLCYESIELNRIEPNGIDVYLFGFGFFFLHLLSSFQFSVFLFFLLSCFPVLDFPWVYVIQSFGKCILVFIINCVVDENNYRDTALCVLIAKKKMNIHIGSIKRIDQTTKGISIVDNQTTCTPFLCIVEIPSKIPYVALNRSQYSVDVCVRAFLFLFLCRRPFFFSFSFALFFPLHDTLLSISTQRL